MVFKVIIKPIAFFDLEEAVDYYEKKVRGLGRRFYNQFLVTIEGIQNKPFTYSYVKDPVRRKDLKIFKRKLMNVTTNTIFSN